MVLSTSNRSLHCRRYCIMLFCTDYICVETEVLICARAAYHKSAATCALRLRGFQVGGKKRESTRSRREQSEMCTASMMFSPPSSTSLALAPTITPHHEPRQRLTAEHEAQTPRSSFTQYQSPRRTPATSLILRSLTPSSRLRPTFLSSYKPRSLTLGSPDFEKASDRFDLLVYLPWEVSIMVLEYLAPKDLCQ